MRVGILTGGGDCPGLNPAIRGATLRLIRDGHTPIGVLQGSKAARFWALRARTHSKTQPMCNDC
jgi:6-phosphofructokinase